MTALATACKNLLEYANKYSDHMAATIGRGAHELGKNAPSDSVAGIARAAIANDSTPELLAAASGLLASEERSAAYDQARKDLRSAIAKAEGGVK